MTRGEYPGVASTLSLSSGGFVRSSPAPPCDTDINSAVWHWHRWSVCPVTPTLTSSQGPALLSDDFGFLFWFKVSDNPSTRGMRPPASLYESMHRLLLAPRVALTGVVVGQLSTRHVHTFAKLDQTPVRWRAAVTGEDTPSFCHRCRSVRCVDDVSRWRTDDDSSWLSCPLVQARN